MTEKPIRHFITYSEWTPFIMTVNCKYCGSELPDTHPAIIAQKIEDNVTWSELENDNKVYGHPVGSELSIPSLGRVTVEDKKLKPTLEDLSEAYGYFEEGSYPQGTEYETYIILRFGDTFFKKTGHGDSYGEIVWDGVLKETKAKQITVTAWE